MRVGDLVRLSGKFCNDPLRGLGMIVGTVTYGFQVWWFKKPTVWKHHYSGLEKVQ